MRNLMSFVTCSSQPHHKDEVFARRNALMKASGKGYVGIVKSLLKVDGIDVNARSRYGCCICGVRWSGAHVSCTEV